MGAVVARSRSELTSRWSVDRIFKSKKAKADFSMGRVMAFTYLDSTENCQISSTPN